VSFSGASCQDLDQIYIFKGTPMRLSAAVKGGERGDAPYRYICELWCRCEKKVVCTCIDLLPRVSGGSISVFALRETGSSKWCFVPHYLNRPLYRDRPSDSGGAETGERKKNWEEIHAKVLL